MSRLRQKNDVGRARRFSVLWLAAGAFLVGCAGAPPADRAPAPVESRPEQLPPPPPPAPPPPPPAPLPEPPPAPKSVEPAPPPAPAISEEERQALALLSDLQRLAVAPAEDIRRELGGNASASKLRGDSAKVRMAWLLSVPGTGSQNELRALTLLEQVIGKSPSATPTKQIAVLLHAQISERVRAVHEERKKTEAVQQKLDALKALERSLQGRRPPAPGPTPTK